MVGDEAVVWNDVLAVGLSCLVELFPLLRCNNFNVAWAAVKCVLKTTVIW